MVTHLDILGAIEACGLAARPVCLHSSLRSFGWIDGGAETVVRAFLDAGCSLMVPAFADAFRIPPPLGMRPQRNGYSYGHEGVAAIGKIFDPHCLEVDRDMGTIARAVVHWPGRSRGDHAFQSFAAVGPLAETLVRTQRAADAFAPLRELADAGGWVLLAGVPYRRLTLLHLAEKLAGREPFRRWAYAANGDPAMMEAGGCSEGFDSLRPNLQALERRTRVGQSDWIGLPAREVLEVSTQLIRQTPSLTHCAQLSCERCRDALLGGPILPIEP